METTWRPLLGLNGEQAQVWVIQLLKIIMVLIIQTTIPLYQNLPQIPNIIIEQWRKMHKAGCTETLIRSKLIFRL